MSEEKPVTKNEETSNPAPQAVNSKGMKAPSVNDEPTAKDAGRFAFMMITLFLALIPAISTVKIAFLEKKAAYQFLGALIVFLPVTFSVLLSLPSIIIGRKHKEEKDTYKVLMILGIIMVCVVIVCGIISGINAAMIFR